MLSYGNVRKWQAEPLHQSVGQLNTLCTTLVGLADEVGDAGKTSRWHGEAATGAAANLQGIRVGLEDLISEVAAMRTAMGQAADSVSGLMHGIAEAETLAGHHYLRIEDNGTLTDTTAFTFPSGQAKKEWEADRARLKAELLDRVKEILRRAEDLDTDLHTVVSKCLERGGIGTRGYDSLTEAARAGGEAGHLSTLEPPRGTPAANAAWWSTLSVREQTAIMALHPDWIGNLDGIPAKVRDEANRKRIAGEYDRLRAERDKILARLEHWRSRGGLRPERGRLIDELERDLSFANARLDSLDNIQTMLAQGDRQLLVLDTSGERVKAAISIGDVDTADHVAVFTPGMNSTIDGGQMAGYDNDMRELREKTEKELVRGGNQTDSVAMVTWLNYEPPLTSEFHGVDALSDDRATDGGNRLARFLEGINSSRPYDDPHLTALGHSYGSLTTGIALRDHPNTGVDEAVFFGSPGIGVDHAADLHIPQGHGYNMIAARDPIPHIGQLDHHGSYPGAITDLHQLSTDASTTPDGRPLEASRGHSEYLRAGDKDTTSEWHMANIIAGNGIVR